jgi:hypothetical protein
MGPGFRRGDSEIFVAASASLVETRPLSSTQPSPSSQRPRARRQACLGRGHRQSRRVRKEEDMTAEKFRNVSTMVAALFVSVLMVAATTSMPIVA